MYLKMFRTDGIEKCYRKQDLLYVVIIFSLVLFVNVRPFFKHHVVEILIG
jgi:hypothetical protein